MARMGLASSRWQRIAAAMIAVALSLGASPARAADVPDAAALKAAFFLNFVRYTEWPPGALPADAAAPVEVMVLGSRPVAAALRSIAEQAQAQGQREVRVRHLEPAALQRVLARAERTRPHAIFVAGDVDDEAPVRELLARVREHPVLTVGDGESFAADGGMLGLVEDGRRIAFDANPAAIRSGGLNVSARVLKLARVVEAPR
jgi:hypothetical protein